MAVRLPKEFRFEGDSVRIHRVAGGVLLEPVISDPKELFRQIDAVEGDDFMPDGRCQVLAPSDDFFA